jgi:hypothetical protein
MSGPKVISSDDFKVFEMVQLSGVWCIFTAGLVKIENDFK